MAFQITSAAFQANGRIPDVDTCYTREGDQPPPLTSSGASAGTKSFALIVDHPDAPGGTFCHWAAFDIPAAAAGLGGVRPTGAHETMNDFTARVMVALARRLAIGTITGSAC